MLRGKKAQPSWSQLRLELIFCEETSPWNVRGWRGVLADNGEGRKNTEGDFEGGGRMLLWLRSLLSVNWYSQAVIQHLLHILRMLKYLFEQTNISTFCNATNLISIACLITLYRHSKMCYVMTNMLHRISREESKAQPVLKWWLIGHSPDIPTEKKYCQNWRANTTWQSA